MEMKEDNDGTQRYYVIPGYTLVTFDAVVEPSVKSAYLKLVESVERRFATRANRGQPLNEERQRENQQDQEAVLLEAIRKHFDIKPIGRPVKKRPRRTIITS